MANYIDPTEYELHHTLESTLNHHSHLLQLEEVINDMGAQIDQISRLKGKIEQVYAYYCTDFSAAIEELCLWRSKLRNERTRVITDVVDHFMKEKML